MKKAFCFVLAVCLLLSAVLIAGCKKKEQTVEQTQPAQTQTEAPAATVPVPVPVRPELAVTGTEEKGDVVVVTTTFCTFSYPFAFSDMLQITAEENKLVFSLNVEENIPLYTICFDGEAAINLGSLYIPATGETVSVMADLMPLPEGAEEHEGTFYAAQETFNDVANSLSGDPNFTQAN